MNATPGALQQIKNLYSHLRKSEKQIADYILEHSEKAINQSISEIAQESNVSEATVIRFCKATGFTGFQDLKISLARSSAPLVSPKLFESIIKTDNLESAVQKIFNNNYQALENTIQSLNYQQLKKAAKSIRAGRVIYIYGLGTSGFVAQYAAYRFSRIGLLAHACVDSHFISLSNATIQRQDVVIAISQSGSTKEIAEALEFLRKRECLTITITGHPRSPVAKLSEITLISAVHETPFESGGMPSLMSQLSVVDALMVGAALEKFDESIEMIQATTEALKSKKY